LDCVTVVDNGVGGLAPGDPERRQLRFDRPDNADWRLLATNRADFARGVEIAPLVGASSAFVGPMRPFGGEAIGRAERAQYEPGQGFQCVTTVHTILLDGWNKVSTSAAQPLDFRRRARVDLTNNSFGNAIDRNFVARRKGCKFEGLRSRSPLCSFALDLVVGYLWYVFVHYASQHWRPRRT
jgi:hypothetical protein